MKNLYITLIAFFFVSTQIHAQEKSVKEKRGDKYSFSYSYDKAIVAYSHTKHLTLEGQRRLAMAYHKMDSNVQSEQAYSVLLSSSEVLQPEDYYNYSVVLNLNGKHEQSIIWMNKFSETKPNDLRVIDYKASKSKPTDWLADKGKYKIDHMNSNTSADDFGPAFYIDKIVFASSRETPKFIEREDNWHRQPYLDMFVADAESGQLTHPKIFSSKLNGKFHDGPASFNKNGNFIAFTRNNYSAHNKDRTVELQIWFSTKSNEKWSDPEPFIYNNTSYSVGQPCLSADGNTMYFTCDMPGGFGKSDIYKTSRVENGVWTKPENMGNKINTEGDELFPFYEEKSDNLFFASNGRAGLGGLDIFICEMKGTEILSVNNAGAPLNTSFDDFALIMDSKMKNGYFSSNRIGGSGSDDIYSVVFLQTKESIKRIEGIAKASTGEAVPQTFITLLDGKDKVIATLTTKDDGAYSFIAQTEMNFKLNGNKEGYGDGNNTANTYGDDTLIIANLTLLKNSEVVVKKFVPNADLGAIMELNTIFFDLDKSNIRPDAEKELNKIVSVMNEHPDMQVELRSHTDCRASVAYNQVLSDKRAKASADYIRKRITHPSRISGKGYGKTNKAASCVCQGELPSNCTEEEYQQDRNTKFIIKDNLATAKR